MNTAFRYFKVIYVCCAIHFSACSTAGPKTNQYAPAELLTGQSSAQIEVVSIPNSNLLRVTCAKELNCPPIFATSLKTCPYHPEHQKLAGQARQLLVGFNNLKIIESHSIVDDRSIFRITATAEFDDTPVTMLNFTIINDNCLEDIIFFSTSTEGWWQDTMILDRLTSLIIQRKVHAEDQG